MICIIEIKSEETIELNELGIVFASDLLKYLKCGGDKKKLNIDHVYNLLSGIENKHKLQVPIEIIDKGDNRYNARM